MDKSFAVAPENSGVKILGVTDAWEQKVNP